MADHIRGRNVEKDSDRDAPLAVLLRGDNRGSGGAPLADHVDLQFDRSGADHHGAGEHRVHRAHRLFRKPFGRSDNRLCEHLRALDHLPLILTGESGLGDELALPGGLHVEEVQHPLDRPLRRS
jgi:hypothetical protein